MHLLLNSSRQVEVKKQRRLYSTFFSKSNLPFQVIRYAAKLAKNLPYSKALFISSLKGYEKLGSQLENGDSNLII